MFGKLHLFVGGVVYRARQRGVNGRERVCPAGWSIAEDSKTYIRATVKKKKKKQERKKVTYIYIMRAKSTKIHFWTVKKPENIYLSQ